MHRMGHYVQQCGFVANACVDLHQFDFHDRGRLFVHSVKNRTHFPTQKHACCCARIGERSSHTLMREIHDEKRLNTNNAKEQVGVESRLSGNARRLSGPTTLEGCSLLGSSGNRQKSTLDQHADEESAWSHPAVPHRD
jgi:hypothetical protein